jgi:ketosteroid isomerase-like protein
MERAASISDSHHGERPSDIPEDGHPDVMSSLPSARTQCMNPVVRQEPLQHSNTTAGNFTTFELSEGQMAQGTDRSFARIFACVAIIFVSSTSKGLVMDTEQNSNVVDTTTRAVVRDFNDALNRQDLEVLAVLLAEDTVFEDTSPQPDGTRLEGKTAVVAFWREWLKKNPGARFEAEDTIICGNRAVVRWIYRKVRNGQPWHLHGVDVFTVRNGKVAAKLAYVKG